MKPNGKHTETADRSCRTPEAEMACPMLAANLLVALGATPSPSVVLVTSVDPDAGKTTVAWSLVMQLSRQGKRMGLVTTDCRRPPWVSSSVQLKTLDPTDTKAEAPEPQSDAFPQCRYLPDACHPAWFESPTTLTQILPSAEVVLVDAPVLEHPFTRFLVPNVHGILLAADARKARLAHVVAAAGEIRKAQGRCLGVVVNRYRAPIPPWLAHWLGMRVP